MSDPLFVILPGNQRLARSLAKALNTEVAEVELRQFPDGETYLRYKTPVRGRDVVLVCTLDRPDAKVLPLIFAAATARDLGAGSIGLVCPYLAYMRQDRQFQPGEAITSAQFAAVLSAHCDWLVTVDPHLHRRNSLAEIYSIPAIAVQAAPLIAEWIETSLNEPLLIGPDEESEQWVKAVAEQSRAPHTVLHKVRRGDRDVEVSVPDLARWSGRTPVLLDDIVSTGRTMIAALEHLARAGAPAPVCVAVHGIFAEDAYRQLLAAGAALVASCNTIPHESNAVDVTDVLVRAIAASLVRAKEAERG